MRHHRMIGFIVGVLLCGLAFGAARAQTGVAFTLFLENDSLTLYLPVSNPTTVSLIDFTFETVVSGQRVNYRLDQFTVFQALRFNAVPVPICFQLKASGATPTLPMICNGVATLVQPLSSADIFWYDSVSNGRRTLLILGGNTNVICAAGQVQCDLVYLSPLPTFTLTSTFTLTPTITPTPVYTFTPTATFTPTPSPTLDIAAGLISVTRNADWTPIIRDFDGVDMALVPVGCFMMGSNDYADEQPVHEVCFDAPFWIDVTEVTQAQFRAFGGAAASDSYFSGDQRPVEQITWFEAYDYCVNKRPGDVRLPSEAEWEYAARGVESWVYPWGDTFNGDFVVYGPNANETAGVGSRPSGASWVGALDMSGNVWEWVNTIYGVDDGDYNFNEAGERLFTYPYVKDDGRETYSGNRRDARLLHGGSWDSSSSDFMRAPSRNRYIPVFTYADFGFRCAVS